MAVAPGRAGVSMRRILRSLLLLVALVPAMPLLAQEADDDAVALNAERERSLRALLAAPAPDGDVETTISGARQRAKAAAELGDSDRQVAELKAGIARIGAGDKASLRLHKDLASAHSDRGETTEALREREAALALSSEPSDRLHEMTQVASGYAALHDRPKAEAMLAQAKELLRTMRYSRGFARFGKRWESWVAFASGRVGRTFGRYGEAEEGFRACVEASKEAIGAGSDLSSPSAAYLPLCGANLVTVLISLGKLAEAEAVALDVQRFAADYAERHQRPLFRVRNAVPVLANVQMQQGRFLEASRTLEAGLGELRRLRAPEHSSVVAGLRWQAAMSEMARGNWAAAEALHRARYDGLRTNATAARVEGQASPEWGYTLLRLGQNDRALEILKRVAANRDRHQDELSISRAEGHAFLGLGLAANGRRGEALAEMAVAVPRLLELAQGERSSADAGALRAIRLGWILDGYVGLLGDIAARGEKAPFDPVDEAFRYADLARGSVVQRALLAAASRTQIDNPQLAEMVRREQDLEREMSALSDALNSLLARGRAGAQDKAVAAMRADFERMQAEHRAMRKTLAEQFPEYGSLTDPSPPRLAEVARQLKAGQVLLSIYVGQKQSLVWAVGGKGAPGFAVVDAGGETVAALVARVRKSLEPQGDEIPPFDFAAAYELYRLLLLPVAAKIDGAAELIVVPTRELGQIPLGLLTTLAYRPGKPTLRFADYADAPWLLSKAAISQQPSVAAFIALRRVSRQAAPSRPYIGYGDPLFSLAAAAAPAVGLRALRRRALDLRDGAGQSEAVVENPFRFLSPLPDTALEIRDIARVFGADPQRDVFLGRAASESNVKKGALKDYRTVMFATHGLVPGDLRGLQEPALALANPEGSGDQEDGLLTLNEILALKLNADWVVLSACNTGSADGRASEAVSGLGRAFFYAGARALLVSNWPVETESARRLTTNLFRLQAESPGLNRAQALRRASLALMAGVLSDATGKPLYSYAHPLFWAPFSLIGDSGS